MIIDNSTLFEEEEQIGTLRSLDSTINDESLPFIFEIFTSKLYSKPIEAIVREITSNCYDANVESGSNNPIIINLGYDNDTATHYIEFCDSGIGLSPERIDKNFRTWLNSTKRDTNGQLGFYGLGSKSMFAYNEYFTITTISNFVKYKYVMSKGNGKYPVNLMSQTEELNEVGTKIRLDIKSSLDFHLFITACNTELVFFDNVFINCNYINNEDYKIIEGNTFKYRTNSNLKCLSLVIENVIYPIDTNKVLSFHLCKNKHFALKFKIGEIDITPSRESILYSKKTINLINDKYIEFCNEINDIYVKQLQKDYDSFDLFVNNRVSNYITFDEHKIDISEFRFTPLTIRYKPFIDYKINERIFIQYEYAVYKNGKEYYSFSDLNVGVLNNYDKILYLDGKINNVYNKELDTFILIRKKNVSKSHNYRNLKFLLGINKFTLGNYKILNNFNKTIHKFIKSKSISYTEGLLFYKKNKNVVSENNTTGLSFISKKRIKNKPIVFKDIFDNTDKECDINELQKYKFLIYVEKRQSSNVHINNYNNIFKHHTGYNKIFKFIIINVTELKRIENKIICYRHDNFNNIPELKNVIQKIILSYKLNFYFYKYDNLYFKYSDYYLRLYNELYEYLKPFHINDYSYNLVKNIEIDKTKYGVCELDALLLYKSKIQLINTYLNNLAPHNLIVYVVLKFIKLTKLNHEYYKFQSSRTEPSVEC